jgi:hypothetical protein
MDGITVITTEAVTINIIISASTMGTEDGLSRSTDAPGITAIGKRAGNVGIENGAVPVHRPNAFVYRSPTMN